ncbi:MAG: hypothetical protein CL760_01115 [Chloroflexi bacterium]|nr:hypothetical protein [Chloroflexota bacterium]|tara:strand:- start:140 stop:1183 length:1044 start_codon:yes stop_codon:yes gene_type:complete
MKRSILSIVIISATCAYANNYKIIISKEHNTYDIDEAHTVVTEYTEWSDKNSPICNTDIEPEDIYIGRTATQTTTCNQEQERIATTKKVYSSGTEIILSTEVETQNISLPDSVATINGTHVEDSCKGIIDFNPAFTNQDGNYPISINGHGFTAVCDMTRDGGGWTKVARVPSTTKVIESDNWLSTGYMLTSSGSMAIKFFNATNPEAILLENTSSNSAFGGGDLIVISRSSSSWNWTPGDHNNDNGQTGRFYDHSINSWSNIGTVTYASHRDQPWQSTPFSFTINNMQNGYSGQYEDRLSLGGTFISGNGGSDSNHIWYSFWGNPYSEDPITNGGWKTQGSGAIWMK